MKIADALAYAPILGSALSPDGRKLVATVPRYDTTLAARRLRLHALELDGSSSWRPVGDAEETLFSPVFSPDSTHLAAFRERADGRDLVVLEAHSHEVAQAPPGIPLGAVALKWWGSPGRLALIGLDDEGTRRVFAWTTWEHPPVPITPARRRVGDFAFAPRSDRFAWTFAPPRPIGAPTPRTQLYLGQVGETAFVEVELPENPLGFLAFSPDGRHLALLCRPDDEVLCAPRLWVVEVETGLAQRLVPSADGWITGYDWSIDGPSLVVAVEHGVVGLLVRVDLDGKVTPVGPVDTFLSAPHCDRSTGRIVHLQQDGHVTQHLRLMEPHAQTSTRLSRFNARIDEMPLRPLERVTWRAPDGLLLEGLLMVPDGEPPFPMITWLHGGPAEHLQRTFSAYWQVFAAAGFAVFAPNYRGSSGRGDVFLRRLVGDLCGADVADVDAGVRRLIVGGVAHRRRVGLMGWSYGGALALSTAAEAPWVRAIVAGAPVLDWLTVFGARSWPAVTRAYFDGEPWEKPESYDRASPVRRLGRMNAPTLILHGDEDDRVPLSQSRLAQHLLTARGVQTDLRVFPGEGHVFHAPWAVQEMLARTLAWFTHHLTP